mgnify:CR=1 FL=1
MDDIVTTINHKIDANKIEFHDLTNLNQDMRDYLDNKSILFYINCKQIQITINSQINKIVLKHCDDIKLNIRGLVSGIEINKCANIIVECIKEKPINSVVVENSLYIDIKLLKEFLNKTYYEIDKSKNVKIMDTKKIVYLSK